MSDDSNPTGLTPEEVNHLRQMILEDQRRRWLAKQMLTIATWVAAILVGLTTSWDFIKRIIKSAGGA